MLPAGVLVIILIVGSRSAVVMITAVPVTGNSCGSARKGGITSLHTPECDYYVPSVMEVARVS